VLLNFSDGTLKPATHMNEVRNTKLHYALLSVGGVISFLITAWGCLASLGLDYQKPAELFLAMCFILPFPCFLLSMRSIRWSATSLWALFVGLWILRAFTISPNPQPNPVDTLGAAFFLSAVAVQLASVFKPKYTASAD
jgi:FtsH-binding integral membrane protein